MKAAISVMTHPNDTIFSAFGSPNQTFQDITHHGTTLAESRLAVKF
jgi:hypothetical protein